METTSTAEGVAERVVVRYTPVTDTVTDQLGNDRFASFLRKSEAGAVEPGDEWEHFVSCSCGTTEDVTLTVEAVDGGDEVGAGTEFVFEPVSDAETDDEVDGASW